MRHDTRDPILTRVLAALCCGPACEVSGAMAPPEMIDLDAAERLVCEETYRTNPRTSPEAEVTVRLGGLKSGSEYTLTSFDAGKSRRATGSTLAETGLAISLPKPNASEIVLVTVNWGRIRSAS